MKYSFQIKAGIVLIIISSIVYLLLLVIPFLDLKTSVKLTLVPIIIIVGEITFWAGTFFLGKELIKRYKSYLNPLNWFRKKSGDPAKNYKVLLIRPMEDSDAEIVLSIYKMGIEKKNATFEQKVPLWEEWGTSHHVHSRFVAIGDGEVAGWAAVSPVSKRDAYKGVAEISIYIHDNHQGKGLGSLLMNKVIESSEENGIWTLYAAIFPENRPSLQIHKKSGFRVIGTREKISTIDGVWRDTIVLERRSKIAGQ